LGLGLGFGFRLNFGFRFDFGFGVLGDVTRILHFYYIVFVTRPAMSNPNGLQSQKLCQYFNQGRTLNNILMRAAH